MVAHWQDGAPPSTANIGSASWPESEICAIQHRPTEKIVVKKVHPAWCVHLGDLVLIIKYRKINMKMNIWSGRLFLNHWFSPYTFSIDHQNEIAKMDTSSGMHFFHHYFFGRSMLYCTNLRFWSTRWPDIRRTGGGAPSDNVQPSRVWRQTAWNIIYDLW